MPDIKKPDANPIAAAVLTLCVMNLGHLVINGQQKKWITSLIAIFIGSCLCGVPGMILSILSVMDSYATAERLKNGETIGENEYTNATLYNWCSKIDKTATLKPGA